MGRKKQQKQQQGGQPDADPAPAQTGAADTAGDTAAEASSPPRTMNYGATDATPTPARQAPQAPPPTPATAYRASTSKEATTMSHTTGVIVDQEETELLASGSGSLNPDHHDSPEPEGDYSLRAQLRALFLAKWQMSCLLLAVPVALAGQGHVSSDILFFASFFGLIPLAAMLGDLTEDLALRSNDVIGALINVTFGNATELIISIMALRAGMLDVIKLSLIGSVLGNMLLVLGTAFIVGGLKHPDMTFNSAAVNTYSPLLMLAILSYVIPSAYWSTLQSAEGDHTSSHVTRHSSSVMLMVSRQLAVVMAFAYACYLYFQLVTHKHLFDGSADKKAVALADDEEEDDDEEDEVPKFTFTFGLAGLAVVSILISVLSDVLVDTLSDAAEAWNLPTQFIGVILVPIVGNAAEHASAIFMAARNKLDISVGVALGSSIQIAMFVMPVLVITGWAVGQPLDMNFHPFLTVTTGVSVIVMQNITSDGETNWLEGMMLVSAYLMIALMFFNETRSIPV